MTSRQLRPSPALLVAVLALLVAMGGTSYAALELAKNSVRSTHIKNGQVKTPDLKNNAVTTKKVKDGSLRATDFAAGQLPTGPAGPQGPPGPQGIPGPVDTVTVVASSGSITPGDFDFATASCPAGMEAIGGGPDPGNVFNMSMTASHPMVNNTRPLSLANGQHGSATGWRVWMRNDSGTTAYTFKVMVVCSG